MVKSVLVLFLSATLLHAETTNDVAQTPPEEARTIATLDLIDGSRLVGEPAIERIPLALPYAELEIPIKDVDSIVIQSGQTNVTVKLANGDSLTGTLSRPDLPVNTLIGPVNIPFTILAKVSISRRGGKALSPGEGPIAFCGFNWVGWRTGFEVRGEKVVTLPKAADGFNYGHSGNGRNGMLYTNIGNPDWKDYRAEFTFCIQPADPAFNRYNITPSQRAGYIRFHIADARQSWNEKGLSAYYLYVHDGGTWGLGKSANSHVPQPVGYTSTIADGREILAKGDGLFIDPVKGNRFTIEVKGQRITIHVDGKLIVDIEDPKMQREYDGVSLGYGGIGVEWLWENMGWLSDFTATGI